MHHYSERPDPERFDEHVITRTMATIEQAGYGTDSDLWTSPTSPWYPWRHSASTRRPVAAARSVRATVRPPASSCAAPATRKDTTADALAAPASDPPCRGAARPGGARPLSCYQPAFTAL